MPSIPVLIGLAIGAVAAVTIGLLLGRRRDSSYYSESQSGSSPQRKSPNEAIATSQHDTTSRATDVADRFDVAELSRRLQIPAERLLQAAPTYRVVKIPKPSGGVRRLEIPDDDTKALQRRILQRLLKLLNAHPLACGFEEDTSIVDAALPHQRRKAVIKLDIRRFFESTTAERVQAWFVAIGWQAEAAELLTKLTTDDGHLPQGAPTSPRLSNLINAPLDEALLRVAKKHGGAYTRYADDITLSFNFDRGRKLRGIIQTVRRILKSYGYTMHGGRKRKILRRHQRQQVLGLVGNSQGGLPRAKRRWLRAVRHRMKNGGEATLTTAQLEGWESFSNMVEQQRDEG